MRSLKRRIACRIASQLVLEARDIKRNADGSVSAEHGFRSLKDARRYARFVALQRNPLGRRPIQWLISAGN